MATWRKKMKRFVYWQYVWHRITASAGAVSPPCLIPFFVSALSHAAPRWPNGKPVYTANDRKAHIVKPTESNFSLLSPTSTPNRASNLCGVSDADLGLVYGTKILKPFSL